MARTKKPPIAQRVRAVIGALLRDLRRAAGYRSVEGAAETKGCPASRQTIYQYERGAMSPSLPQFLELVSFFVLAAWCLCFLWVVAFAVVTVNSIASARAIAVNVRIDVLSFEGFCGPSVGRFEGWTGGEGKRLNAPSDGPFGWPFCRTRHRRPGGAARAVVRRETRIHAVCNTGC